jgi:hypothetical protein
LGTTLVGTVVAPQASFNYPVPRDTTLAAGSPLSVVTLDIFGMRSDPSSCTLVKAIAGPKSKPGSPGNVRVQ